MISYNFYYINAHFRLVLSYLMFDKRRWGMSAESGCNNYDTFSTYVLKNIYSKTPMILQLNLKTFILWNPVSFFADIVKYK